ncbi:hypothetical protein Rhe02_79800 [Rhizocola hellebori]|uniref:Uncharacterized protein n=2 Tax=Rhizocola hellebori TaxID=1392758 RepID=A0A8J3VL98_9ACTN|nr:hypothetical protein Rhe02_79800 [Rhizocola hellebori]
MLVLVLAGVVVAALLVAAMIAMLISENNKSEVGDCVNDTTVVGCDQPHDNRITQIVSNVNDCVPPATHAMKDPDGRYLCLVEEVPS